MKKLQLLACVFAAALFTLPFNSCSDDDEEIVVTPDSTEEEQQGEEEESQEQTYHFDIWIALDRHGGMGRDVETLVRSVDSLTADQETIDFVGEGTEVHATMTLESIIKGAYYYQVPVSGDRFSKYTLSDNTINVIQEQPFGSNTYSPRKYTHAWIDDNTLVIMAANGDCDQIIWTKLSDDLVIQDEGTLDLEVPDGSSIFTTSGILTYREQDNKLIYFYYGKAKTGMNSTASQVFTCVIDPSTMEVESNIETSLIDEMAGSAYGELLQQCTAFDDAGNLYVASLKVDDDDVERSHLVRINVGEYDFDSSYDAFYTDGKLMTIQYLADGKALGYAREDALGTSIDSYSHYYCIIDLNTQTSTRISYNGEELPYSGGRFSQRTAVVDGKAYIGVNAEDSNPCIYIYDIATGTVEKGVDIAEGYYFEQIRVLDNE